MAMKADCSGDFLQHIVKPIRTAAEDIEKVTKGR